MKQPRSILIGACFAATMSLAISLSVDAAEAKLPKPKDRWIQVRTANFTLFSNAPEKLTIKAGVNLEQLRAVLRTLFGGMNFLSPVPTYIFVFDDAKSFAPYGLLYQGKHKEVGGYFGSGPYANHVAIVGNQYSTDVSRTVYHEYLHYVLRTNQPGLPLWLNEGLAEFYSSFFVEDGVAKIGYPIGSHVAWLRDHTMIPLSQLMAIDHSSPEYNEGNRRGVFYAQSWALTHFLVIGRPDGATRTGVYYGLLQQGINPNEAFQTAFGTPYKELEAQLRKYLNSRRFIYQNMPISEAIQHASTVTEMSYPEVLYRLGTLLTDLGSDRFTSAAEHFNTSLEFDQAYGLPIAGLGRLDELAGRTDEALKRYEKAAELAPDDFMVNFLLGNRLVEEATQTASAEEKAALTDRARSALKRAVVLRPSFAEAWATLGTTYSWDDDPDEIGVKAMEHAHLLLPKRGDIGYNLTLMYVRLDQSDDALTVVARMKASGVDEAMVNAARRLTMNTNERQVDDLLRKNRAVATDTPSSPKEPSDSPAQPSTNLPGFTDRFNKAVGLINTGKTADAIFMLETLVDEAPSEGQRAATRALLEQTRAYVSFKTRAEEALELANTGKVDEAIAILEPLEGEAPDETQATEIRRLLGNLRGYRNFMANYNEAVDLVNDGDYSSAIAILEELVETGADPRLKAMALTLLTDLKKRL